MPAIIDGLIVAREAFTYKGLKKSYAIELPRREDPNPEMAGEPQSFGDRQT